jgi:dipeptidyl aminopeptidase/acylaminoacyl peptidase
MIGTKLGPYEILEKIGAGGMGEVYRARDARLGRDVAVKILPATLTSDPERLRRFEQEARAAGVLNHPNILAIYDVGTHGGIPYVVSELLEGETLRERLGGSALPPRKAVEIAAQVAHGLAAAHEKGIVHRDLKPENLFVTRDGRVKILDFGLAKLTQVEASDPGLTNAPTTPIQTDAGRVLGTAGYMSPEQVRGQAVDLRSDIFSFGAILHEMLSGARPFQRESAVETMNAILKEDVPELSPSAKGVSPALDRIVRHCLEKRPQERFQSARDLAFDLDSLSGTSEMTAPRAVRASSRGAKPALWILAPALLLVAVAAWMGYRAGAGQPAARPPQFQTLTFRRGTIYNALFTPDGQSVVYGAAWEGKPFEVFLTRPGSPESRSLELTDAEPLAISRSGELAVLLRRRMVVGWMSTGTLGRVALSGGAPREVAEDVLGADWNPPGTDLLVARLGDDGWSLEYPIGKVVDQGEGWISHPRISGDGSKVALIEHPQRGDDRGSLAILDLSTGKRKTLTKTWSSAQGVSWSSSEDEILFTATEVGTRTLRAVTLEGEDRIVTQLPGHVTLHDVFTDGRLLLTSDFMRRGMVVRRAGEADDRDFAWLDWSSPQDISNDGDWILFDEEGAGSGSAYYAMYLRKTDGSPAVRIGEGLPRALSPDGKWVLAVRDNPSRSLVLFPTGAGEARTIPGTEDADVYSQAFLPDGARVVTGVREAGNRLRIYEVNIADGKRRPITPEVASFYLRVSRDGKWIALATGKHEVSLYPVEGGAAKAYTVEAFDSTRPLIPLQFKQDQTGLFLQQMGGVPGRIYSLDFATGKTTLFQELEVKDSTGIIDYGPYLITPDGKTLVYSFRQMISTLYLMEFPRGGR